MTPTPAGAIGVTEVALDALYDGRMEDRLATEYFEGSGFLNFGFWEETTSGAAKAGAILVEKLVSLLPSRGGRILDVACGTGATTRHLLKHWRAADIVGINLSHQQLKTCRGRGLGSDFVQMDAALLGFAGGSFDNVICVEAAFHFRTRERFLKEARRILKPGGCLALSDALISSANRQLRPGWPEANYVTDLDDYARIYREAGFEEVRILDATRECWESGFRSVVRFAHERFLQGEIALADLDGFLDRVYRLAMDLERYVLVTARTPGSNQEGGSPPRFVVAATSSDGTNPPPPSRSGSSGPLFPVDERYRNSAKGYDRLMYWPALIEYFGHSDFVNYGYWEDGTRDASEASENLMEKLLGLIPDKRGKILDVACGKGATTHHLTKHYEAGAITGINISRRQLVTCRRKSPRCTFIEMDATDLRFPDETFDNVICVEAAFHFGTRERFFREALRVLKPGGRLVLSDILLTREAEEGRPGRHAENFVDGPAQYEEVAHRAGFAQCSVVDATEECFRRGFWHVVWFSHEKLLAKRMTPDSLRAFRRHLFDFVPEIRHYLLASLRKG